MKTGQRINVIKNLAKKLEESEYSEIQFILGQFKLPCHESWSEDKYGYCLNMLENVVPEKLVELHEYLYPEISIPGNAGQILKGPWEEGKLRLFISHSSIKKSDANKLKQELSVLGIDSFVAHEDIEPNKEWLVELKIALSTCHALAAFLCNDFKQSNYCDQEVGYALQRGVLVIPLQFEIVSYGFMAPFQGVRVKDKNPDQIASEIRKIIADHPLTKLNMKMADQKMLEQLVDKFLSSSNFRISTNLLSKLEEYSAIPKELVTKINLEWNKNDQIYKCAGIPKRMEEFFKKHEKI